MRLFGSESLMNTFRKLGVAENEQIEHKMLSSAIEKAQKKIESNNYGIRKTSSSMTRSTTNSVRLFTKSAAAFWTEKTCVIPFIR